MANERYTPEQVAKVFQIAYELGADFSRMECSSGRKKRDAVKEIITGLERYDSEVPKDVRDLLNGRINLIKDRVFDALR